MPDVLVAAELRDLVGDVPVPGYAVRWVAASDPTPQGAYVAFVPLLSRPVGAAELAGLPVLKIVANCAVGVDNIDRTAAAARHVIVTNTPDVLTEATADLTWALILAVARRVKEGLLLVESGRWQGWNPTLLLGMELRGRTLGIVGAGRIGQAVGRRAGAFGMRVLYVSRSPKPDFAASTGARRVDLPELLRSSDVVTLHAPATSETRHLLDAARLALLGPAALVINTARGELVDEAALAEALQAGRVAGAGLDVFAAEPTVDPRLIAHPRVVALPHLGSATVDTRRAMAMLAVENVRAVLAGRPPLTPVPRVDDPTGGT